MARNVQNPDRVEIPRDAFLRTTGQLWKLAVAAVVLPWPAVLIGIWMLRRLGRESFSEVAVAIGAIAVIAALIVLLLASVRCPQCSTRLLSRAVRDPEGLVALTALRGARACPECGHTPRASLDAGA